MFVSPLLDNSENGCIICGFVVASVGLLRPKYAVAVGAGFARFLGGFLGSSAKIFVIGALVMMSGGALAENMMDGPLRAPKPPALPAAPHPEIDMKFYFEVANMWYEPLLQGFCSKGKTVFA